MVQQIILFLLALGALVGFVFWIISFKRSFTPIQGEEYQLTFFGMHVFTIKLKDPNLKWYQKFPFYLLFWPFGIASFMYEWVQEMTYDEYLKKVEIAKTRKDYEVTLVWQPKYKPEDLDEDRTPLDKTVMVLVSRKERLTSLREIEGYKLASEFETIDNFRGWRVFTLFFEIKDISKVISRFRQWQSAASLTFKGQFNSWTKGVTYATMRSTTMNQLDISLGRSTTESFTEEINEKTKEFGYIVNSIKEGEVYLAAESQDMLESQERMKKAQDERDTAKVEAETTQIKADAEALRITTEEKAVTAVIDERTGIAVKAANDLNKQALELTKAKYGTDGIGKLPGVYVEAGSGNNETTVDIDKLLENILGHKINQNQTQAQGGATP